MATRRKTSAKPSAGMFSGLIIGLVIGLAAAVAVAFYINKAPMPFMDKASREIENILLPDVRHAPDPNIGLYGGSVGEAPVFSGKEAQWAQELGNVITPPPVTITPPTLPPAINQGADTLGNLIAQLPNPNTNQASSSLVAPPPAAPRANTLSPAPNQVAAAAVSTYYLQAGAFRSATDAEAVRARILMLGLEANVQSGPYNGGTINRVRVGPFKGIDEMNRARSALGKEKIETSVVRP